MTRGANKSEMDAGALIQATEVIIRAYGKVIETSPVTPGCVADIRMLPYSKDKIKSALVLALKFTEDRWMRRQLKAGYLRLADYQGNVGANYQVIDGGDLDAGDDLDPSKTSAERGTRVVGWLSVVQQEKERLRRELRELGF